MIPRGFLHLFSCFIENSFLFRSFHYIANNNFAIKYFTSMYV